MSRQMPVATALVSTVALAGAMLLVAAPLASGRRDTAAQTGVLRVSPGEGTVASVGSTGIDCGTRCRAELPLGTKVVLAATAKPQGPPFDYWQGDCVGAARTCEVIVDTSTTVTARFAAGGGSPGGNPLKVSVGGRGVVRSDIANVIDCGTAPVGTTCSAFLTRVVLKVRATPALDSIFIGWTGAPGCSTSLTCQVDFNAPHAVAATFRLASVPGGSSTLRVRLTGATSGTVTFGPIKCTSTCSKSFTNGSLVTLRALEDYAFQGWSGSCEGDAPTCVLAISGPESVEADFQTLAATRGAVNVTRSGPGRVESSPPGITCGDGRECSAGFLNNQLVALTATTDWRHTMKWGGAAPTECVGKTCTVKATSGSGIAVSVIFTIVMDDLRVGRSGDGQGNVTSTPAGIDCGPVCTKKFARGTRVLLKPQPTSTSRFVGWTGGCTGTGGCPIVLRQPTFVTARFDRIRDELRVAKEGDGGGTIRSSPAGIACGTDCTAQFPRESTVELRAVPNSVSRFAGWSGACTGTGGCAVRLAKGTSVRARFEHIRDELQVVKTGKGTGSVSSTPPGIACGQDCDAVFLRGAQVVLRATPNDGSRFAGWSGGCRGTGECRLTVGGASRVETKFVRICAAATATGFTAKVAKGPRRVLVTIRLDAKASARLRLFRAQTKVAEKTMSGLGKGSRTLRLDVPRSAKAGTYRIVLRLTDVCGGTKRFEKAVTVPRRG